MRLSTGQLARFFLSVALFLSGASPALPRAQQQQQSQQTPAGPPREEGRFRKPELVELTKIDKTIRLDVRYATANNFLGRPVYISARAFLQKPAAKALARVSKRVRAEGYGLLVFDGYRPWSVTKIFWDATPADKKEFVADPAKGSRHNRGCAVDLTLYDLKTGREVEMTGGYDEMTERSHADYKGGTEEQRARRDLLRRAMEAEGFQVYAPEWWHFDYKDWRQYPVLDVCEVHGAVLCRRAEARAHGVAVAAARDAAREEKIVVVLDVEEAFEGRRVEVPLDADKETRGVALVKEPKRVRGCEYAISISKWLPEVVTLRVSLTVTYADGGRYAGEKLVEVRRDKTTKQKFRDGVSVKAFYD